jgi:hypothetical protein
VQHHRPHIDMLLGFWNSDIRGGRLQTRMALLKWTPLMLQPPLI